MNLIDLSDRAQVLRNQQFCKIDNGRFPSVLFAKGPWVKERNDGINASLPRGNAACDDRMEGMP